MGRRLFGIRKERSQWKQCLCIHKSQNRVLALPKSALLHSWEQSALRANGWEHPCRYHKKLRLKHPKNQALDRCTGLSKVEGWMLFLWNSLKNLRTISIAVLLTSLSLGSKQEKYKQCKKSTWQVECGSKSSVKAWKQLAYKITKQFSLFSNLTHYRSYMIEWLWTNWQSKKAKGMANSTTFKPHWLMTQLLLRCWSPNLRLGFSFKHWKMRNGRAHLH